jgi:hypothetical protein
MVSLTLAAMNRDRANVTGISPVEWLQIDGRHGGAVNQRRVGVKALGTLVA